MADNTKALVYIGETGVILRTTLKDTNPDTEVLEPFSLDGGWTVTMTAQQGSTVMLNDLPCAIDPDQVTNKGKITCTFNATTTDHPNLRKGVCKLQFKGIDPAGNPHYFPKKFSKRYGTIEFDEALG